MKKKHIVALIFVTLFAPSLVSAEQITITVKGMVCSFCAQGIKKTFGKNNEVKDINVDLDKKLVRIETHNDNSLGDEQLRSIISDAGYDVLKIERATHD